MRNCICFTMAGGSFGKGFSVDLQCHYKPMYLRRRAGLLSSGGVLTHVCTCFVQLVLPGITPSCHVAVGCSRLMQSDVLAFLLGLVYSHGEDTSILLNVTGALASASYLATSRPKLVESGALEACVSACLSNHHDDTMLQLAATFFSNLLVSECGSKWVDAPSSVSLKRSVLWCRFTSCDWQGVNE